MSPLRRRRPVDPAAETEVVEERPERREVVEEEEVPPPRPPLIWPWLLLLLLLVLGGALAWWLLTREEDKTTVPNVIGLQESVARARLAEAELEPDVDRRLSRRPRGIVFAQVPGAGTQLAEGERVEMLVSSGIIRVVVPSVQGLPQREAVQKIEDAGLRARVRRVFAGAPEGDVVEQEPRGGERARRGSTVELIVSKGRNLNRVPDVLGLPEAEAVRQLRELEFEVRIFDVPSPDPRGTVVAQVPRGGVLAPPEAGVRINVSTGEATGEPRERTTTTVSPAAATVRVPNVVGIQQTPALRRLRNAGLRRAVLSYARSPQPRGRVLTQRPSAGSSVPRSTAVRLTVSAGSQTQRETVPDVVGMDEETARETLTDAGFRPEVVDVSSDVDGEVVDQQPAGGTSAPRGSVVTLFVGRTG